MMPYILADSVNSLTGDRIITAVFPRFWKLLQAEMRTHRMLSQSHYSSRAIPVDKVIDQVTDDPYIPIWTQYQKGMGGSDTLSAATKLKATQEALDLRLTAISMVSYLKEMGIAKQEANRYLEPWMHGGVVVTGNSDWWNHFFYLRCRDGVQPDFRKQAEHLQDLCRNNKPKVLEYGEWHLPFFEDSLIGFSLQQQIEIATARCARISYDNFEGNFSYEKDKKLHDMLIADNHMTPLEHSAMCMYSRQPYRNLTGFKHYRQFVEEGLTLQAIDGDRRCLSAIKNDIA